MQLTASTSGRMALCRKDAPHWCTPARHAVCRRTWAPAQSHGIAQPANQRLVAARAAEKVVTKWWEKETPNMRSIDGIQELVDALADAGDALVIVDFYAQWCGACRALYPKLLRLMEEHPDVVFLKVDFEANRAMCKTLGVKVLPYFHVYHGALGRVAAFSCTVSKLQRMRDALEEYAAPQCSLEPAPRLPEFPDIVPHPSEVSRVLLGGSVLPATELRLNGASATNGSNSSSGSSMDAQQHVPQAAAAAEPAGVV